MADQITLRSINRVDPQYENHVPMTSFMSDANPGKAAYDNAAYQQDKEPAFVTESSGNWQVEAQVDKPGSGKYFNVPLADAHKLHEMEAADNEKSKDDDDSADEDEQQGTCLAKVQEGQKSMEAFLSKHGQNIKLVVGCATIAAYAVYFGYAMSRGLGNEDQIRLLWLTCFAVFICCVSLFQRTCGPSFSEKVTQPIVGFISLRFIYFKWTFIAAFSIFVIAFIVVDVGLQRPQNLISIVGFVLYIALLFVFSANPGKVRWRPVCWGLGIQFVFALLILKTTWGFEAFKWLGDRVSEFLVHTDEGSEFVFGVKYEDHPFAFKVLPVVIFFSTTISILYYLGVMQLVILKLAWVMQVTLGTTAAESVNAAGNIFIGQTEAPLLIRPLIEDMTASELHAVMTGGFATIAGSVMATYILLGVQPNHLITASVMAAPAALAMSKLSYPETKRKKKDDKPFTMEKPPQKNMIEAASAGASASISLVANIAANLIAFMALLAFVNATLAWLGNRVGLSPPDYPDLSFQLICSYVLWPFAFVMGVASDDCRKVAELIGYKTFLNEFVAYTKLGELIDNQKELDAYLGSGVGNFTWVNGDIVLDATGKVLEGGVIAARSVVIATYALCGFANVSSIGMVMGALGSMSEKQKPVIARIAVRAMITGNIVCFMNACAAGLLYDGN